MIEIISLFTNKIMEPNRIAKILIDVAHTEDANNFKKNYFFNSFFLIVFEAYFWFVAIPWCAP